MRRAAAVDRNHGEIVAALRAHGHLVQSLAGVGMGCPDLLVGVDPSQRDSPGPRFFCVMEVKDGRRVPSERRLTVLEKQWHNSYRGWPVYVVESPEDALKVTNP